MSTLGHARGLIRNQRGELRRLSGGERAALEWAAQRHPGDCDFRECSAPHGNSLRAAARKGWLREIECDDRPPGADWHRGPTLSEMSRLHGVETPRPKWRWYSLTPEGEMVLLHDRALPPPRRGW